MAHNETTAKFIEWTVGQFDMMGNEEWAEDNLWDAEEIKDYWEDAVDDAAAADHTEDWWILFKADEILHIINWAAVADAVNASIRDWRQNDDDNDPWVNGDMEAAVPISG